MEQVVHPITGEVLPDDIDVLSAYESRVDSYLRSLSAHYSFRRRLRERLAELRGEYPLPRRVFRTEKQQKVAECPRCTGRYPTRGEPCGKDVEENPFHDGE